MMKRGFVILLFFILFVSAQPSSAKPINETDTDVCEAITYALINSLREPIDQAIEELYKNDKDAPENLTWASYMTEITKIRQIYGVGGLYEITLKVLPYYEAHNVYGEDEVVVSSDGELLQYTHLKTYSYD